MCESCGGGHATNECAMVHEELQYMNNQRQGNYQNYNNQGYIPHLMIGQEQGSSSNAMPR